MRVVYIALTIFILLSYGGCTKVPSYKDRLQRAIFIGGKSLVHKNIKTSYFNFFTLSKLGSSCKNEDIKVYIEGDGLAWITRSKISSNPTPINPIALSLMKVDHSSCKIYIARPCQYNFTKNCKNKYWTNSRFSQEIIDNYNELLNHIKQEYKNKSFTLVGYSGGGTIATLISATRYDISKLITIAGNLDIKKWAEIHNISTLQGSLNPVNYTSKLEELPQFHLIGNMDNIVPKEIFLSYLKHFNGINHIKYYEYSASHSCFWESIYKEFLKKLNKK